jgi:hypothetical protein
MNRNPQVMAYEDKKKPVRAADEDPTQLISLAPAKHEVDIGHSLTPPMVESVIATSARPNEIDVEASRQASRPVSTRNQPVKVPRLNRRGLFGRFAILAEVEEPTLYPKSTKWFITFVVAMAGVAAPLGSTIVFREDFLPLV